MKSLSVSAVGVLETELNKYYNSLEYPHYVVHPDLLKQVIANQTYVDITLTLGTQNFMEKEMVYTSVNITLQSRPTLLAQIQGNPSRTISSSTSLILEANATLSSCILFASSITYSWVVYENYTVSSIRSVGLNPRIFSLKPYTLKAGFSYQILCYASFLNLTVTALSEVFVDLGTITPRVKGGLNRVISSSQSLILDGSISTDSSEEFFVIRNYEYYWECMEVTPDQRFGRLCSERVSDCQQAPICTLPPTLLNGSILITFSIYSIRYPSKSSSVQISLTGAQDQSLLSASILTNASSFNTNEKLLIAAEVTIDQSAIFSWELVTEQAVNLDHYASTLTVARKSVTMTSNGLSTFPFPLVIDADTFAPNKIYIFRLTIECATSYREATIEMLSNSPPIGGELKITPHLGMAFLEQFALTAVNWVDNIEDYPLLYSFGFSLSNNSGSVYTSLRGFTELSYLNTVLMQGYPETNFLVYLSLIASDSFGASSNTVANVIVHPHSNDSVVNLTESLLQQIPSLLEKYDSDGVLSLVNMVSRNLNYVNCSNAPRCRQLYNRESCTSTPHTCGPCLSGYLGVVGHSNSICYPRNSSIFRNCSNLACQSGACDPRTCEEYSKVCRSNCSGHGKCVFKDPSGAVIPLCMVSRSTCLPSCECDSGYAGLGCQFSSDDYFKSLVSQNYMCLSIILTSNFSDASTSYLSTLLDGFSQISHSGEILEYCSTYLNLITQFLLPEYLDNIKGPVISSFIESISSYLTATNSSVGLGSINSLVTGLMNTIAAGQRNLEYISDGISISIGYYLPSDDGHQSISAPSLNPYLPENSVLFLTPADIESCSQSDGGISMRYSITQFSSFAYPEKSLASVLLTPVVKFTILSDNSKSIMPSLAATTLVVTFSEPQHWNNTLPNAVLVAPHLQHWCNVSNYSEASATFACSNICAATSSNRRRLDVISSKSAEFSTISKTITSPFTAATHDQNLFSHSVAQLTFVSVLFFIYWVGYFMLQSQDATESYRLKYLGRSRSADEKQRYILSRGLKYQRSQLYANDPGFQSRLLTYLRSYVDCIFQSTGILKLESRTVRFLKALSRNHPWMRPFAYPSRRFPRSIRYLLLWSEIIVILFLDAVFYSLLYPNDQTCEVLGKEDCLDARSRFVFLPSNFSLQLAFFHQEPFVSGPLKI